MKKTLLHSAIISVIGATSLTCQAALVEGTVLEFDTAIKTCVVSGTYPNCAHNISNVLSGSYFSLDTNNDGITSGNEKEVFSMHEGITIGVAQPASGAHLGAADGTESPSISAPWLFFCDTGLFFTTSPINVVNDDDYTKTLDFSGWRANYQQDDGIWDLGSDIAGDGSFATITCSTASCAVGSTFVLDYTAVIPDGDVTGFATHSFILHMEGRVAAATTTVPIPASAWLFTSGLISLHSIARRKKRQAFSI